MHKRLLSILSAAFAYAALAVPVASAQCPVCAIGAVAGVGLARELGVDDSITGLWVGGMMVALTAWTINWLNRKNVHFKGRIILTTLIYYVLFLFLPLYIWWNDLLTNPLNTLFGVNKLVLGTIVGSIGFFGANIWYQSIKRRNGGHAHFPLQKVVWPVGSLVLLSGVFYVIVKLFPSY